MVLLGVQDLYAQPKEQRFRRITIDDGLSQSTVVAICQDSIGFLWFGTKDGLNLYDGYNFTVFKHDRTDSNSIGGSHVRTLMTDKDGNVWAGTRNGSLNRYSREEQQFVRYPLPSVPSENRTLSSIDALLQDETGTIWVGTVADGVFKLDPKKGGYTHYYHKKDDANSLPSNEITSLLYNPRNGGELWIGTLKNGITILHIESGQFSFLNQNSTPKLPDHRVYSLFLDQKGQTWIGHYQGGCVYTSHKDTIANVSINPLGKQVPTFNDFAQTDGRYLWIAIYRQGLVKLDLETRDFEHFHNDPFNLNSISHDDVRALLIDKTGNLWLGTNGGGLNKLSAFNNFNVYRHIPGDTNSLSSNSIRSIMEDHKGNLYLGSYTGLMVVDREHKTTRHYIASNKNTDLANLAVYCLLEDENHKIWIGLEGGGLQMFDPVTGIFTHYIDVPGDTTTLLSNQILSLFIDSKNRFWVGSHSGLSLLDRSTGKFTHYLRSEEFISGPYVRGIVEEYPGYLWLATDNGLIHYNIEHRKAEYFPDLGGSIKSQPIGINSIHKENDTTYWLATQGSGLYKMTYAYREDGFDKYRFECICPSKSLAQLTIYGILSDEQHNLWFSTDEGLYKYHKKNGEFKKFTRSDGLQSNEFNSNAFYKSVNGRMYFGGIDGLTDFYPQRMQFNEVAPPVVITGFKIFNKPYALPYHITIMKEVVLNHNQNYLTFEFAALDYTAPEKNQYAYQLVGFDQDWVYPGSARQVTYSNLPAGDYVFKVKASNKDGFWNEEGVAINISITPAIWSTWWFRGLAIGIVALVLILIFRSRLAGYRERQKLLEEQLKTQSQKLQLEKLKTEYAVSQALIDGQNQEQKRISEDLHDGLGQTLTAASLNLMALETSFKSNKEEKKEEYLANLQLLMSSAIQEVRNISHNLMPYLLAEEGLQAALDEMCHRAMKSSNLKINLQITGLDERIGESNEINLYRIAQEIISNTQKHSGAQNLLIRYHVGNDLVTWVSEDDGIGFDPAYLQSVRNTGLGLKNIQVRVQLMKGKINITTKPGKGVRIEIEVPRG